jgi:hypothetical protein
MILVCARPEKEEMFFRHLQLLRHREGILYRGLRGWEFCTICPFFANFSTFTKISQVPSFQAQHSPVKTVFRQNPKKRPKSQNTPSTSPYQNKTQFPLSSLKLGTSGHARPPKSVLCPPVISVTKFRHGTAGLSNVG